VLIDPRLKSEGKQVSARRSKSNTFWSRDCTGYWLHLEPLTHLGVFATSTVTCCTSRSVSSGKPGKSNRLA
jgi:hypothetical protein